MLNDISHLNQMCSASSSLIVPFLAIAPELTGWFCLLHKTCGCATLLEKKKKYWFGIRGVYRRVTKLAQREDSASKTRWRGFSTRQSTHNTAVGHFLEPLDSKCWRIYAESTHGPGRHDICLHKYEANLNHRRLLKPHNDGIRHS